MKKVKKISEQDFLLMRNKVDEKYEKEIHFDYFKTGKIPLSKGICFSIKREKYSIFEKYENEILIDSFNSIIMFETVSHETFETFYTLIRIDITK